MTKDELFSILLIDPDSSRSNFSRIQQEFSKDSLHPVRLEVCPALAEALEKFKKDRHHMILADLEALKGDGEVIELLNEMNRIRPQTPLIVLVPSGEEAFCRKLIKLGATDFLVKTREGFLELPQRLRHIYRSYELTPRDKGLEDGIAEDHRKLAEVNEKFRKLSVRDELTRLYNHRYLQEKLNEEFSRAVRYGYPFSCLFLDIDHFRRPNEGLGYSAGDEILKEFSGLLLENCRLSDLISRFGGEEFVILLPHIDYPGAAELAERLRCIFAEHTFLARSRQVSLTVSIGISSFPADVIKHKSDLLNFADQALFRSKAAGRNRVTLYRDLIPTIGDSLPHLKISEEKILEFQKRLSGIADKARRGYIESSKALIAALEAKDRFTAGHSGRVARLSMQLAEAMGLSVDEAEVVEHAGLLHDIGKICISDDILLKPGPLSLGEYEAMKQHPYFGYRIVKPIKFLHEEAALILHHHEWFNGEGYPCRLAGNETPLGARIIAVVDSYDTMRFAGGRYKKTISVEEAANELIRWAGKQFDPQVVRAFIQILLMRKELNQDAYDKKQLQEALQAVSSH